MAEGRPAWLKDVTEEALAAVDRGVDPHGICLLPLVDMPNWHDGEWLQNGICDLVPDGDALRRVQHEPYVQELRRRQELLNRVTELDEDPSSDPVNLNDVVRAAKRLKKQSDKDWS